MNRERTYKAVIEVTGLKFTTAGAKDEEDRCQEVEGEIQKVIERNPRAPDNAGLGGFDEASFLKGLQHQGFDVGDYVLTVERVEETSDDEEDDDDD